MLSHLKTKKFGNFPNFPDSPPYSLEISHILGFQKKVHMEGNPPKKLGNKTLGNFYYPRPPLPLL